MQGIIEIMKTIIEKGRFAQWLGIVMAGSVALVGGIGGWLIGDEIITIVIAGLAVAGGVEAMKLLRNAE